MDVHLKSNLTVRRRGVNQRIVTEVGEDLTQVLRVQANRTFGIRHQGGLFSLKVVDDAVVFQKGV